MDKALISVYQLKKFISFKMTETSIKSLLFCNKIKIKIKFKFNNTKSSLLQSLQIINKKLFQEMVLLYEINFQLL